MFYKVLIFIFSIFSFPALADTVSVNEIFQSVNERLSYMEDVALYKAQNHKAIEDIPREKIVIEKAGESAQKYHLVSQTVSNFTEAQISVAKAIQYRYRAELLSQPSSREPRDLKTVIRPALISLSDKINEELAEFLMAGHHITEKDWPTFQAVIHNSYVSESDKKLLFSALRKVRPL